MHASPFHVTAALKAGDLVYAKRSSSGHFKAGQEFKVQHYRASRYYNDPAIVSVWDGKAIRQFEEEWLVTKKPNFNVGDDVVDKQSPQTPLGHVRSIKKFDDQSKEWIYEVRQSNGFTDWLESELVASQVGGLPTGQPQQVTFNYGDRVRVRTNTGKISPSPTAAYAGEEGEIVGIVGNGPHYQVKFDKQIGRLNQWQSIHADDLELWQQDEAKQQVAPQTEDRKSQVADRIYDITLSGKPEDHEGELQELFAEWKQMTGRDKPRFLEGRKIKAQPSSKAAGSRFVIGDQVMTASGSGKVQTVWWDNGAQNWMYEINIPGYGTTIRTETALMKHSQNQVGAQVGTSNHARFKRGDTAWVARPAQQNRNIRSKDLTDGDEVAIVSDPQIRANGEIEYYVQKPGQSSQLWPEKWLTDKQPKYSNGDQLVDWNGDQGTVVSIIWDDRKQAWFYEMDMNYGGSDTFGENDVQSYRKSKPKPKPKPQQKKFKPGDRVRLKDDSKVHQSLEGMVYTVDREEGPSADHKDTLYRIKDSSGRGWYATSAEMEHVDQQQPEPEPEPEPEPQEQVRQTQQEQHDQRQKVDPDQQPRQTFHPSQQELMSHIKDKGTPYFPPTPEGQKAFEEYLIKQHNDFYENLKRNWSMLIKKYGKKGQLMVRKQKDALYVHAMKYAKKD